MEDKMSDPADAIAIEKWDVARSHDIRRRRSAGLLAATLAFLIAGTALVIFGQDIGFLLVGGYEDIGRGDFLARWTAVSRLSGGVILIAAAAIITYLYGVGYSFFGVAKVTNRQDQPSFSEIISMIRKVQTAADKLMENRAIIAVDSPEIALAMKEAIATALPDAAVSGIEQKYGDAIRGEALSVYMQQACEPAKQRLTKFERDINRKASSSLAWGVFIAAIGAGVLASYILMPMQHASLDIVSEVLYVTSRLSIVAIIEVVAFFFLRQHRSTLLDQKYIQNEITNIDLKALALSVAAKVNDTQVLSSIVTELGKTERNFALKKDEVSVFHNGAGDTLPSSVVLQMLDRMTAIAEKSKRNNE